MVCGFGMVLAMGRSAGRGVYVYAQCVLFYTVILRSFLRT